MRWSSSAARSGRASCRSCQASRWAKRMTAGRISTGADDAVDVMMPSMPAGCRRRRGTSRPRRHGLGAVDLGRAATLPRRPGQHVDAGAGADWRPPATGSAPAPTSPAAAATAARLATSSARRPRAAAGRAPRGGAGPDDERQRHAPAAPASPATAPTSRSPPVQGRVVAVATSSSSSCRGSGALWLRTAARRARREPLVGDHGARPGRSRGRGDLGDHPAGPTASRRGRRRGRGRRPPCPSRRRA